MKSRFSPSRFALTLLATGLIAIALIFATIQTDAWTASQQRSSSFSLAQGGNPPIAQLAQGVLTDRSSIQPAIDQRSIKHGFFDMSVSNTDIAKTAIESIAINKNGTIDSSSRSVDAQGNTHATLTLIIPQSHFGDIFTAIKAIDGTINTETITSESVTNPYIETLSSLNTLQAEEGRIVAMQSDATTTEDTLVLEDHLATLRSSVITLQSQIIELESRPPVSLITVTLNETSSTNISSTVFRTITLALAVIIATFIVLVIKNRQTRKPTKRKK